MKCKSIIRIKANFYPNQNKYIEHEKHVDYPYKHKGAIFFINTNNGFTILEDWAHGALLKTEAIDDERGVVLEESRTGKGANDRMNKITIPARFYNSQYAKRLPIGKDDILQNFSLIH